MKLKILMPTLATMAIAACTKAPETSEAGQELEERLQRMEAQLARIEAAITASHPAAATGLQTKEQLKIYVSGAVVKPGQ